jgi:hypothetical protein
LFQQVSTSPNTLPEVGIGNLTDYFQNTFYGSPEEYQVAYEEGITDNNARQTKILEAAKQQLLEYKDAATKNKYIYNYKDLETVDQLLGVIDTDNFEKFKQLSYKLHWSPSSLLISAATQKQMQESAAQQKADADLKAKADAAQAAQVQAELDKTARIQDLVNRGYSQQDAEALAD